jgi:hypothetical protein
MFTPELAIFYFATILRLSHACGVRAGFLELATSFSFPLSDKNASFSVESDFEYPMPSMASIIPAVSLSDLPVLPASCDVRRYYCREAAAPLNAPAGLNAMSAPTFISLRTDTVLTAQKLPRTLLRLLNLVE